MKHVRSLRLVASALVTALVLAGAAPAAPAAAIAAALRVSEQKVLAFDGTAYDHFGTRAAIWGDTAVISAQGDDGDKGAAYVYVRNGDTWLLQQKLTASDGFSGQLFGRDVAVWADTILVGAPHDDANKGAVYVFTRAGTVWTERAKLRASDRQDGDFFGEALALSGDTAIIGAPNEDEKGTNAGAAYVFTGSGASWNERVKLMASDGQPDDFFGWSVALDDGVALVGAPMEDEKGSLAGAVYVFTGSGASWTQRKLTAADGSADDLFGTSVAVDGTTALIGAYGDDSARGSAYVFASSGGFWTQRARLVASDRDPDDQFGYSVALSGGAALIAAPYDDQRASNAGAAYVFTGIDTSWTQRVKLTGSDSAADDMFAGRVAVSGGTALVTAWDDDDLGTNSGSAWFFSFRNELVPGAKRIAGPNRFFTAAAASQRGFPIGAPTVVVATGMNWPDALGGSALAGAVNGPLLLTRKDALPAEVTAEIVRLGATRAYILGSTAAVSTSVENALVSMLGRANVTRLGGASRYETAQKVASETIRLRGAGYLGIALVATGGNYPDATAASPLAARQGTPILLANPAGGAMFVPAEVHDAIILGSTAAVSTAVEASLKTRLGDTHVVRIGGVNRYDTAAKVAALGVAAGMKWNGVGLATGENFPDALAAGPMLARDDSVLLLTRPTVLSPETREKLVANAAIIDAMHIFGDTNAVSAGVEAAAKAAAGIP